MRSQTQRAVESILETDPGVSDTQRKTVMGVLRGEAPTLSSSNRDMMAEVMKLLETAALPKTYMRRNEAAEYLGCSPRHIDMMKHDGDVPFCRLGGRLIVFKRADLDALMERRRVSTVLEDSRQMVCHQPSQRQGAEDIEDKVTTGTIAVLPEGADSGLPLVDEFNEATDHRFHMVDVVTPVHAAGFIDTAKLATVSRLFAKPSTVDTAHSAPTQAQPLLFDTTTLETLANYGILDALTTFYRIHIRASAHQELAQKVAAFAWREETRLWHMDLWNHLRRNPRFHFVPHKMPEALDAKDRKPTDFLPFMACFIANDTKTPLLADDRVCQAFVLNEQRNASNAAFGTDVLALALQEAGRLDQEKTASVIRQLVAWRYRFIVPPATVLKNLVDQYLNAPPGQGLQEMAEYIQDCMRDPGLFAGPEKTELGDSMAMRSFLTWISTIAEFLVLVWVDEKYSEDAATRLTSWVARELLPTIPKGVNGPSKYKTSIHTASLFVGHTLIKAGMQAGNPRMAEAMKAIKLALRLDDGEYTRIVTETINAAARANA